MDHLLPHMAVRMEAVQLPALLEALETRVGQLGARHYFGKEMFTNMFRRL